MKTIIKSVKDVEDFFSNLLQKESLNFHPDERFENYVQIGTNKPSYTPKEADLRNKLMESSFEICELEGVDIYEIGFTQLFVNLNPNKNEKDRN